MGRKEGFSDKYMVRMLIKTFNNYDEQKSFKLTFPCHILLYLLESSLKGGRILQSQGQHSYKGPLILIKDIKDSNSQNDPRGL